MKNFLKSLKNEISSYYYHGTVYDEIPNHNDEVKIENSFFKIFTRKQNIYKNFKKLYNIKNLKNHTIFLRIKYQKKCF